MINDSDIRHVESELADLRNKLRRAQQDQTKYEAEIHTKEQDIDQMKRDQRREKDRAADEKKRTDTQTRLDKERKVNRPAA